ncbi:MAG: hypothetical protein J6B90_11835 [Lachnospiraceae bacterium]|nr:hypothetical protein [Lachnospiraceae bacterium]
MEHDIEYRRKLMDNYKKDVEPLFRYLSWFEEKKGKQVSSSYTGNDLGQHSMVFPVYDGTLMGFVKEVQRTSLTDRNYVYIYTRNRINSVEDELKMIEGVTIKNTEILTGILSKYICGGMTKGWLWSQAVEEGIFLAILLKFKELFEMWSQPLSN